jgi:hypothetical protein
LSIFFEISIITKFPKFGAFLQSFVIISPKLKKWSFKFYLVLWFKNFKSLVYFSNFSEFVSEFAMKNGILELYASLAFQKFGEFANYFIFYILDTLSNFMPKFSFFLIPNFLHIFGFKNLVIFSTFMSRFSKKIVESYFLNPIFGFESLVKFSTFWVVFSKVEFNFL